MDISTKRAKDLNEANQGFRPAGFGLCVPPGKPCRVIPAATGWLLARGGLKSRAVRLARNLLQAEPEETPCLFCRSHRCRPRQGLRRSRPRLAGTMPCRSARISTSRRRSPPHFRRTLRRVPIHTLATSLRHDRGRPANRSTERAIRRRGARWQKRIVRTRISAAAWKTAAKPHRRKRGLPPRPSPITLRRRRRRTVSRPRRHSAPSGRAHSALSRRAHSALSRRAHSALSRRAHSALSRRAHSALSRRRSHPPGTHPEKRTWPIPPRSLRR